jgi:hypothetical protein
MNSVIARSTCDEAIQTFVAFWIASFIGRRFAPIRWLAMTENPHRVPNFVSPNRSFCSCGGARQ